MHAKTRHVQNPLSKAYTLVKLNVKWIGKNEFYCILAILILGLASIILPIALSYLTATIIISNSGKILTIKTPITYQSEIRGVFLFEEVFSPGHSWTLIAETCAKYGINAVFCNDFSTFGRRPDDEIRAAIGAFHAYGIEYHSVMSVLQDTKPDSSLGTEEITPEGEIYSEYSHCPIKAHDYVLSSIRNYLGNFSDVDGIMLDFIRYSDVAETCYCPYCRAAFEEWLGETISNWTEFYPDQPRWEEFLEWRTIPLTALVKDIHDLIKSINPNIVISEAAWTLFSDCPMYWRKFLGQDTAKWIAEGYIDCVAPMMYTTDIEELENFIDTNIKYWMGGQPEGKIPLVAFLRVDHDDEDLTPKQFKNEIDLVRSKGLDGWIIWRYGGPGYPDATTPDIRNYLSAINLPETFTLTNINVETTANSATITWFTTLPTTSKIEYSTSPLFSASLETWGGFNYWDITRIQPLTVSDNQNVTEHSITLTELEPGTVYFFRVQSQGESDVATSIVLTFNTKS